MEEDGGRWKKMEEDGRKKKFEKKVEKNVKKNCLESAGDGLGTLVGVQIAPITIFWSLGYEKKISESHGNLTNRFVRV